MLSNFSTVLSVWLFCRQQVKDWSSDVSILWDFLQSQRLCGANENCVNEENEKDSCLS